MALKNWLLLLMALAGMLCQEHAAALTRDDLLKAPPFSLRAAELVRYQPASTPKGLDVEVLFEDVSFNYDAVGRATKSVHRIYRVLTAHGAEDWGSTGATFSPWYQLRPQLRARVLSKSGSSQELDPKTLVEGAARNEPTLYDDARQLSGPLPNMQPGAVVEELAITTDKEPFFVAGGAHFWGFWVDKYTDVSRVRVSAPEGVPLRARLTGSKLPLLVTKAKRVTYSITQYALKPLRFAPSDTEPEIAVVPTLEFSIAKSWRAVAAAYSAEVDRALEGFDAKALVTSITQPSDTLQQKVSKVLAFMSREVRYTGLELGARSIVPTPPKETLERRFGDCKDKSTLLVALLRSLGLKANVALLRTGPGLDVSQNIPGLGRFDHAIVHVSGLSSQWIDPASGYAGLNILPAMDQNRSALVASPNTTGLTHTSTSTAADNRLEEDVYINIAEAGLARVKESTIANGTFDISLRDDWHKTPDQLARDLGKYVQDRYGAQITSAVATDALDLGNPIRLDVEAQNASYFEAYDDGGFIRLSPVALLERVPSELLEDEADEAKGQKGITDERFAPAPELSLYVSEPHRSTQTYHITLPDSFVLGAPPRDFELGNADFSLRRTVESIDARHLRVQYSLNLARRVISFKDQKNLRDLIRKFRQEADISLRFTHEASELISAGKFEAGVGKHLELLRKHPEEPVIMARFAEDLTHVGLGFWARQLAKRNLQRFPDSARVWASAGWTAQVDDFGQMPEILPNAGYGVEAYSRALALEPQSASYKQQVAFYSEFGKHGIRFGAGAELVKALALRQAAREDGKDAETDLALLQNLIWQRDYKQALDFADTMQKSSDANGIWLAIVAKQGGRERAEAKARDIAPDSPSEALANAVANLLVLNEAKTASDLAHSPLLSTLLHPVEERAALYTKLGDSATCVKRLSPAEKLVYEYTSKTFSAPSLLREGLRHQYPSLPNVTIDSWAMRTWAAAQRRAISESGLAPIVANIMACAYTWKTEEVDGAVRVVVTAPAWLKGAIQRYYLARTAQGYVLIQLTEDSTATFAQLAATALRTGHEKAARKWLDWADQISGASRRHWYTDAEAFRAIYRTFIWGTNAKELRLATAVLAHSPDIFSDELLNEAAKATPGSARHKALTYAASSVQKDKEKAIQSLRALHASTPADLGVWSKYIQTLLSAKRGTEARAEIEKFQSANPTEHSIMKYLNGLDLDAGKYREVEKRTLERLGQGVADADELDEVAWASLFSNGAPSTALQLSEAAVKLKSDSHTLRTLALLHAELKQFDRARSRLLESLVGQDDDGAAKGDEWLVLGRIAEGLGLPEAASYAYSQVPPSKDSTARTGFQLAERRLRGLAATAH
ncbi:MAG: DUF3857 domain-containing protein [Polyangiaceae bacterium]|nr:DUF3857 domain-containing protein [Polyangiaceae bacterium]